MTQLLPEPPQSLVGAAAEFYAELTEMLDVARPPHLEPESITVAFGTDDVDVRLRHTAHPEWEIWATVADRSAIVGAEYMHEHFDPSDTDGGRAWTTVAVDFIAELLQGDIEVRTTKRGETPIAVEHIRHEPDGTTTSLGPIGYLVPGRMMVWRPKRMETERFSFF